VYLYAPNNYYHNEPAITLAANYGAGAMVGISNTTPSENLDVTGNAAVSGNLIAGRVSLARVNEKRGALFLAMAGDFNHALYNNFSNLDGEGSWDGSKWNVFAGLNIRVGAGNAKKSALYINETGNVGIGTTNVPERLNVEGAIRAAGLSLGSSYRFNKMLAGHALCGANNGGIKEVRIDFPEPFADTPQAIVTPRSEGYYEDTFAITVKYIDRTHFKVNIMRLDSMKGGWAQNLRLDWIAWGR
jgi:hypothetical protein